MPSLRNWLFAALLTVPILIFFGAQLFNHEKDLVATGFIQYDNVTYAGNAIQYTWLEHNSIFYANRLNGSHGSPNIYFNPQLLLIAGLMKMGIAPGLTLILFTLLSALLFFRVAIAIYDEIKPGDEYRNRNILMFSWGGGLLCLSGFLLYIIGYTGKDPASSLFLLDPAHGWWGLNAGRSLIFSLEAWYHFLFFLTILMLIRRKWIASSILLLLLSVSHPFTGIELLLIVFAWMLLERFVIKDRSIPNHFLLSVLLVLAFHVWYYLVFLNRNPEHHSVFQQYSLNWRYRFYHFIPAYILVIALFLVNLKIQGSRKFIQNRNNRLFIFWGFIAFILANHELFIKPMQPLHFTRGYVWSALFFLGIPALSNAWKSFASIKAGFILTLLVIIVFLSDNTLWIWMNSRRIQEPTEVSLITREQEQVLDFISKTALYNDLIVSSDEVIPYLCSIKTKSNIWISHPYNTPFYANKKLIYDSFMQGGALPNEWPSARIIFVVKKKNETEAARFNKGDVNAKLILTTPQYLVYVHEP